MSMTIEEYMVLPYQKVVTRMPEDQGGGFLAEVPLLGKYATCAWGETEQEALETLTKVMRDNISSWIEDGLEIPLPEVEKKYSGKISLRVPPSLHKRLAELAEEEEVSMNAMLNNLIYEALGVRRSELVTHYHHHDVTHHLAMESGRSDYKEKIDKEKVVFLEQAGC